MDASHFGRGHPEPLSTQLRRETGELHRQAERAGIMREILRGQVELQSYCELLCSLHTIYCALETALTRQATHPTVSALQFSPLFRQSALAHDLEHLAGREWRLALQPRPSALEYAARLGVVAQFHPLQLVAHAYVRYLGDLSGGQRLKQVLRRALPQQGEGGFSFYDLGDAEQVARSAFQFRAGLDSILEREQQAAVLAEAKWAFAQHIVLFRELLDQPRPI